MTEEPGVLQSTESQRVDHDLVTEQLQSIQGVRFVLCYITSTFNYPKTVYCTNIMGKVILFLLLPLHKVLKD